MLPVDAVLPELLDALDERPAAVLQAPPGAGKTTRVPLALLDAPWRGDGRIIVLEPRRLAARAAAYRMADLLGEQVGETVGYRVRLDTQVSQQTRIEVVTEGVLTRMLQDDPTLDGVAALLFDEYHERSLQADLGLALALDVQQALRDDLRLLVMSATLDGAAVAEVLGDAPRITSEGRMYPVETHYADAAPPDRIEPLVAATVQEAVRAHDGDVLVFLPGAGEIRRTEALLDGTLGEAVDVMPLFGNLPRKAQDAAIAPSPAGRRKVVLATSIAETSLTIEGVRVVVDSGQMRVPRFDPGSGMTRLATVPVSRASADQRRGRAGRLGPGVCFRLWTPLQQQHLAPHGRPEILEADLAPLVLELACWGTTDPDALRWMDEPPSGAFGQARDLLGWLGALDGEGRVTPHGREMARFGVHPRLAHMLLRGRDLGLGTLGCEVAALLSERDVLRAHGAVTNADLRLRVEALRARRTPPYVQGLQVDRGAVHHVRRSADHLRRRLRVSARREAEVEACGLLVAFAYPDRIAQRRPGQHERYLLRNGRAAALPTAQLLGEAPYLAVAELDGRRAESRIFLAAPLSLDDLLDHFHDQVEPATVIAWDADAGFVRARRQERLGALTLKDGPLPDPDPTRMTEALLDGVREHGLGLLNWTKSARQLQERLTFLHHHAPDEWPDATDEALLATLGDWLAPHVYGMKRADDLQRVDVHQALLSLIDWSQREALDALAPTHLEVPSGSRIRIDYSTPEAPVLPVRLQELFGATETPRIHGGRVPLTLHLLSPAQRPVQITQDLAGFWQDTYFDVKKDMKGRYPKHYWPDDPLAATPTNRAKPRKR